MAHAIYLVEGVGPHYAKLLGMAGVTTTERLLEAGASRRGRMQLSRKTGISDKLLFKWVNMSDLLRVRGVAAQYAELLEAAGVDTVEELRSRNADSLVVALSAANGKRQLVRTLPNSKRVDGWIEHARSLRTLVSC